MHENTRYRLLSTCLLLMPLACAETEGPLEMLEPEHEGTAVPAGTAALVDDPRPAAQTPGFDVDIDAIGSDVVLSFADQPGATAYSLWASDDPYFEPGDMGSSVVATSTVSDFTVAGAADGNTAQYWRITTDVDQTSTTLARWVQALGPAYNSLGFPLAEGAYSASQFLTAHPEFSEATIYDSEAGYYRYFSFGPWDVDFTWNEGESIGAYNDSGADYLRQFGHVPVDADIAWEIPAYRTFITYPLSMEATTASGVMAMLPQASYLNVWDNASQTFLSYQADGWGTDFPVEPGMSLMLALDEPLQWPPGYVPPVEGACSGRVEPAPTPGNECVIWEDNGGMQTDLTAAVMASSPSAPYVFSPTTGGTLTLCEGTYPMRVEAFSHSIVGADMHIQGAGSALTVLEIATANAVIAHGRNSGVFTVSGLTVEGGHDGFALLGTYRDYQLSDVISQNNVHGLGTLHKQYVTVDDAWFRNNSNRGITVDGGNHGSLAAIPGGHSFNNVCVEGNANQGINAWFIDLLDVSNSEVRDNGAEQIYAVNIDSATLDNVIVTGHDGNNAAVTFWSTHSNPASIMATDATLDNVTVTGNGSTNLTAGGIAALEHAVVTCTNSNVSGNTPGDLLNVTCS